jgi:beta-glucosidase
MTSRPWMDASMGVNPRVALLLAAMTLDEKVAQLGYGGECSSITVADHPHGIGGCSVARASEGIRVAKALRHALSNSTRLGIPPSIFGETTHSGGALGTTVFPMPCAQGASWNTSLVEEIARANAVQLRACGGDHALSPVLQVCTDPRFGRMEENFAEDPFMVAVYGAAAARGLQGHDGCDGASSYLRSPREHVASQAKHYAMYGAGGKDGYTPFGGGVSTRELFEVYLRPWRDYALSGGRGVMASHNLVDWTPMHANGPLLTGVLRNRFGLAEGYIGSDNTNVEGLADYFVGYASNESDAAAMSVSAGVDQDMPGAAFLTKLAPLVSSGALPQSVVDRAAANVLRKKFASRLFDLEPDPTLEGVIDSPSHRRLARRAAEQSAVLLMNRDGALPLQLGGGSLRHLAVVGPFADGAKAADAMLGGYSPGIPSGGVVTIAEALRARANASGGAFRVSTSPGCSGGVGGPTASPADFETALKLAAEADAVVVALGTASCGCCQRCGNGEVGDRMSLELEGRQLELLEGVVNATRAAASSAAATRPAAPVIVILVHGRPVSFGGGGADDAGLAGVGALLAAWRPGEEGGAAIANLLAGDANPSGKLAQAWQRHAGFIHSPTSPWFQLHTSMKPGKYFGNGDQSPLAPLFPFGYGLSYTDFSFGNLTATSAGIPSASSGRQLESLAVSLAVDVVNNGSRAGATVVIATYSKLTRGVVRHMRDVCAFAKVMLQPGERTTVHLKVRLSDLARFDPAATPPGGAPLDDAGQYASGAWVVDGGTYSFFASPCVANPALRDLHHEGDPLCPHRESAIVGASASFGTEGSVFGVYL